MSSPWHYLVSKYVGKVQGACADPDSHFDEWWVEVSDNYNVIAQNRQVESMQVQVIGAKGCSPFLG